MSDAASQLPLNELKDLLVIIKKIDEVVKNNNINLIYFLLPFSF